MTIRVRSNRPPPEPFAPKIPDRDPNAVQKTIWFPQRRMALLGYWKDDYPNPRRPVMRPTYETRWFWPRDRVWVTKVEMADDGGIENLFLPILILNLYAARTKIVTVYEKIAEAKCPN